MAGRRILLINKAPAALAACIESMGDQVVSAKDGVSGIQMLYVAPDLYDLVVLNADLPGLNGWDALRAIRQDWVCSAIPILMIIQQPHEAFYAKGLPRGADEYLVAPFTDETFMAYIDVLTAKMSVPTVAPDDAEPMRPELIFSVVD